MGTGPLSGLRVLDLTRTPYGAFATLLLGDLGADVIRIEVPVPAPQGRADPSSEDPGPGGYLFSLQSNKRRVPLDLDDASGLAAARRLAVRADAMVEDMAAGSLAQWRLDYPACSGDNPRLVYCSVTPFGRDGPRGDAPVPDPIIQALSGVMSVTAASDGVPVPVAMRVSHAAGALYAAHAVVAGLYAREASGQGQHVEVALRDSLISLWGTKAAEWLATGRVPQPLGTENPNRCPSELFRTADDRYVYLTAGNDRHWRLCCEALGCPEVAVDPAYATNADRVRRRADINRRLGRVLAGRTQAEWLQHFERFESLCAPFLSLAEALAHPQATGRGAVIEAWREGARLRSLASPVRLSATPPLAARTLLRPGEAPQDVLWEPRSCGPSEAEAVRPAGVTGPSGPIAGAGHPVDVPVQACPAGTADSHPSRSADPRALSAAAGPEHAADAPIAACGPLSGVVILDFSRVLSGPFCTMLLGDLGAEVIKIESLTGDESRTMARYPGRGSSDEDYFYPMNRNKVSLAVDLKAPEGRAAIRMLAGRADVVVENFAVGVAERLGVGHDTLRQENPALVYCSISGFGQTGPLRHVRTYDTNVQAMAGVMAATRSPDGAPLLPGLFLGDISAGLYAVLGVLAALYHRRRTGVGQYLDISMLESLLSWWLTRSAAAALDATVPPGGGCRDEDHLLSRAFVAADGRYVHVAVTETAQWEALGALLQRSLPAPAPWRSGSATGGDAADTMVRLLAERIRRLPGAAAAEQLLRCGIPAAKVLNLAEVAADPEVVGRGVFAEVQHPRSGRVRQIASPYRFSATPASIRRAPPLLGEQTREILTRCAGLSPADAEELVGRGIVAGC